MDETKPAQMSQVPTFNGEPSPITTASTLYDLSIGSRLLCPKREYAKLRHYSCDYMNRVPFIEKVRANANLESRCNYVNRVPFIEKRRAKSGWSSVIVVNKVWGPNLL